MDYAGFREDVLIGLWLILCTWYLDSYDEITDSYVFNGLIFVFYLDVRPLASWRLLEDSHPLRLGSCLQLSPSR